ncbi:MAG: hypothetical protein IPP73_18750 [Chitinophagaceae bacterium]|nr:hypothetical protein [Chitinophagaceae bacterium]
MKNPFVEKRVLIGVLNFQLFRLYKAIIFESSSCRNKNENKVQEFDCCSFEIEMIRKQEPEWGWQNNVCQYLEDGRWYIENAVIKAQNLVN